MKAVTWRGVNELGVEDVPEPTILNDHDVIVEVGLSATCGSDLHLLGGYIPAMRAGDVLGHEFMGEVVEVGRGVTQAPGGRPRGGVLVHQLREVLVLPATGCTPCATTATRTRGSPRRCGASRIGGCYGYSHALGGYAGSHAEYIRVPYADHGAFTDPRRGQRRAGAVRLRRRARPAGWGGPRRACSPATSSRSGAPAASGRWRPARRCCSAPSASSSSTATTSGSSRSRTHIGAETLDYESGRRAGRAARADRRPRARRVHRGRRHGGAQPGPAVRSTTRSSSSCGCRPTGRPRCARRSTPAARAAPSSSSASSAGFVDKFPLGAVMNKGLTLRGAQQHGHRYIPMLLDRMAGTSSAPSTSPPT